MENQLTSGLCDNCIYCVISTIGDNRIEPVEVHVICEIQKHIIEPTNQEDKENQTIECLYYEQE